MLSVVLLAVLIHCTYGQDTAVSTTTPAPGADWFQEFFCAFTNGFCGMTQDKNDNYDWNRGSGRIPHVGTGPQFGDHTGGDGFYIYINSSSPRKEGDLLRLISPTIRMDSFCSRLSFWYYAFGLNLGSLTVRLGFPDGKVPYSNWSMVFLREGPSRRKEWLHYETTALGKSTLRYVFEGVVGNGFQGYYAIDDINIKAIPCPEEIETATAKQDGWAILVDTYDGALEGLEEGVENNRNVDSTATTVNPGTITAEFPPWAIALLVVGCLFILATIAFLIGRHIRKRQSHSRNGGSGEKYLARTTGIDHTNDFALGPSSGDQRIRVDDETTVRRPSSATNSNFRADYETQYGFGLRLGVNEDDKAKHPRTLAPIPKELLKEAEKLEKKAEKRQRRQRSRIPARQRRKMRYQARREAEAQEKKRLEDTEAAKRTGTFSMVESNDHFGSDKNRPIPLPPANIRSMMDKMRSPSNPLNKATNSVTAIVEPNSRLDKPRKSFEDMNMNVEDVDHFDDDDDDSYDDDDYEDGDEDVSDDDPTPPPSLKMSSNSQHSNFGGNQVRVTVYSPPDRLNAPSSTSNQPNANKTNPAPMSGFGLYDGLDDDDDN